VRQFKELFYPAERIVKTKEEASFLERDSQKAIDLLSNSSADVATVRSMHVDNIMMGKRQEDVDKEKDK